MTVNTCPRCEARPCHVNSTGRVQSYCRGCKRETNRIYKRRRNHGVEATAALERARRVIFEAWDAGALGKGPLRWYLGMTEEKFDLWMGERES